MLLSLQTSITFLHRLRFARRRFEQNNRLDDYDIVRLGVSFALLALGFGRVATRPYLSKETRIAMNVAPYLIANEAREYTLAAVGWYL